MNFFKLLIMFIIILFIQINFLLILLFQIIHFQYYLNFLILKISIKAKFIFIIFQSLKNFLQFYFNNFL